MDYNFHFQVLDIYQLKTSYELCPHARFYVEAEVFLNATKEIDSFCDAEIYLCLPHVLRKQDILRLTEIIQSAAVHGILVRNAEELFWLCDNSSLIDGMNIVLDAGVLIFNSQAFEAIYETAGINIKEIFINNELNEAEIKQLKKDLLNKYDLVFTNLIYGRLPMMISANCIKKTNDKCNKHTELVHIEDRYSKKLPVYSACSFCYNVIYNSVPISLHSYLDRVLDDYSYGLVSFTDENDEMVKRIIEFFMSLKTDIPYKDYTTGHFKRGVE